MLDKKMLAELNQQINEELYSAYIYQSMSADLEYKGFKGMATWMRVQTREEQVHADIFANYILERGEKVELQAIKQPSKEWDNPLQLFKAALKHEQHITGRINEMVKVASEINDNATYNMLQWFVEEQVEEEANAMENVQNLEIVGDEGKGLLMVDREMGARTFVAPTSAPYYPKSGQESAA